MLPPSPRRDLPPALKARFTELYVGETSARSDLVSIVAGYLAGIPRAPVEEVVDFYTAARAEAETTLLDSANQKPQYSLRTLSRALEYARSAMATYGLQRALFDGLTMTFVTLLSNATAPKVTALLDKHILRGARLADVMRAPPEPAGPGGRRSVLFEHFWVEAGDGLLPEGEDPFVLTPSVRAHLATLARAVLVRRYPILLQARSHPCPAPPAPPRPPPARGAVVRSCASAAGE